MEQGMEADETSESDDSPSTPPTPSIMPLFGGVSELSLSPKYSPTPHSPFKVNFMDLMPSSDLKSTPLKEFLATKENYSNNLSAYTPPKPLPTSLKSLPQFVSAYPSISSPAAANYLSQLAHLTAGSPINDKTKCNGNTILTTIHHSHQSPSSPNAHPPHCSGHSSSVSSTLRLEFPLQAEMC